MPWLTVVLTVLLVVVLVLFLPGQWSRRRGEREGAPPPLRGAYRDDDRYWYGLIYNNQGDPDLVVPKRFGLGWTINFGHPWGRPVLIGTLLAPVPQSAVIPRLGVTRFPSLPRVPGRDVNPPCCVLHVDPARNVGKHVFGDRPSAPATFVAALHGDSYEKLCRSGVPVGPH